MLAHTHRESMVTYSTVDWFKFKSFIVRCTEQHKVRLGTEMRTRQCKATWHNIKLRLVMITFFMLLFPSSYHTLLTCKIKKYCNIQYWLYKASAFLGVWQHIHQGSQFGFSPGEISSSRVVRVVKSNSDQLG